MVSLTDELSQKNEELLRHQEEIAQLLSQIVELQHRVKEVGLLLHIRVWGLDASHMTRMSDCSLRRWIGAVDFYTDAHWWWCLIPGSTMC